MVDYCAAFKAIVNEHLDQLQFQSPGLYLDQSGWQALADKCSDPFFLELHQCNLRAIDCLKQQRNGDDVCAVPVTLDAAQLEYGAGAWPSRVLKNIIERNTVAFYVTGEQQFLAHAIEALDECCRRPEEWHPQKEFMGLHGASLETGDMLFALSFGLDALWLYLSDDQRQRYLECLLHDGIGAYMKGVEEEDWWLSNSYNWNPSLHGNAAIAALVLLQHAPDQAKAVLCQAVPCLGRHVHKYLEGGGYSEGPMYQCTAIGHLSDFVIAWYNTTGNDLGLSRHQNFIDTMMVWPYLLGGDGRVLNVSNCNEFGCEFSLAQVAWWSRHLNKPELLAYHHQLLRPWQDTHQLFFDVEFFWHQEAEQAIDEPDVSGLKHFNEIDWVSYKQDQLWLFLTAGWNGGGHNNQDKGHFILGFGQERFLCDPGYGQASNNKHNTISAQGQNMCANAVCPTTQLEEFDGGFYACIDLQPAFPHSLRLCRRHIVVFDNQHILVVDDAEGATKKWRDGFHEQMFVDSRWFWQTRLPVTIDGPTVCISGRQHNLYMTALSDIGAITCEEWNFDGQIRTISWREYSNRRRSIHPTLLSFSAVSCDWQRADSSHCFSCAGYQISFDCGDGELRFRSVQKS